MAIAGIAWIALYVIRGRRFEYASCKGTAGKRPGNTKEADEMRNPSVGSDSDTCILHISATRPSKDANPEDKTS